MARLKNGANYNIKLVSGRLYFQGVEVCCHIDHDDREIRVSDTVPATERLTIAERALDAADAGCARRGPFALIHN